MFTLLCMKETKGNDEMQNRLLYSPRSVRRRRLRLMDNNDSGKVVVANPDACGIND